MFNTASASGVPTEQHDEHGRDPLGMMDFSSYHRTWDASCEADAVVTRRPGYSKTSIPSSAQSILFPPAKTFNALFSKSGRPTAPRTLRKSYGCGVEFRKMENKPLPSPSEWQVFACLCRSGPSTVNELELRLSRLKRYTIETLLLRLAEKGYVSTRDTSGRFRALAPVERALEAQIDRFLEVFIGGDREACAQLIRQAEEHWRDLEP